MSGLYLVTYTGSDIVSVGKAGLFQNGTSAYVAEADANAAKAMGGFTVSGPFGAPPKVERKTAAESVAAEAKKEPEKKAEPAKAAEKPAEKPKAEEKKAEAKPAEKAEAPKAPAAAAAS